MKTLAILGASGHGRVVGDTAELGGWQVVFFDDAWPDRQANGPWKIIGNTLDLLNRLHDYDGIIIAIGDNTIRAKKYAKLKQAGANMATLVHPAAVVSQYANLGPGSVVFGGAVLNIGAQTGCGVVLNTGCTVDHDCVLGDFVHVSPGAHLSGGVHVGDRSWIGVGSCARQQVHIGKDVMVGAGAAVVSNTPDGLTVVGVPARAVR